MKENFCAIHLGRKKAKICDEFGHQIFTIDISDKESQYKYVSPHITFDILQKSEGLKEPIIQIISFNKLREMGFVIISKNAERHERIRPGMRKIFKIVRRDSIESTEGNITREIPRTQGNIHHVQFDEANLRIRLTGPRAGKMGVGDWIKVL